MTVLYGSRASLGTVELPAAATSLLDAAGDRIGGVFVAPKDGTIDRIAVYCTAITGVPPAYDVRLETVSAGVPSGTLIGANTSGVVVPTASTAHIITLTASHAVQAGALMATTLQSALATGSINATFNSRHILTFSSIGDAPHFPRAVQDLSVGTWSQASTAPTIVPIYSDDMWIPHCVPRGVATSEDFNNSSAPDERGNRWTQVGNETCIGAAIYCRGLVAAGNFNIKLYPTTANNSAPLATFAGTASEFFFNTTVHLLAEVFWDGADLTDGTDYRLTFQPSTANNLRVTNVSYGTQQQREAMSHFYETTRTRTGDADDGAWTDDLLSAYVMWPLYSKSNAAAGGATGGFIIGG